MNRIEIDYKSKWATLFRGTAEEIEQLIPPIVRSEPSRDEPLVRIIRGRHCQDYAQLMAELAAVFQFPYYFGHNWDAFNECIQDLWWMKANSYLLVITDFDQLLPKDREGRRIFIEILKGASDNWSKVNGWPLSTFQTDHPIEFRCLLQQTTGNEIEPAIKKFLR